MNKKLLIAMLLVAALVMSFVVPASADSGTVTLNFFKSDNTTGVSGGILQRYASGGSWANVCTTDASGTCSSVVVLPDTKKTVNMRLLYYGGTKSFNNVDVTTNPTLTANTTPVTVRLETCTGTPLVGKASWYAGSAWGGWIVIGNTPASTELLPGTYSFRVYYSAHNGPNSTFSNGKDQDINSNPTVVFNTTKVTLYGNNITYYENAPTSGWVPFVNPSEMLPNTVKDFKFNGIPKTLTITGCTFSGGLLTLIDEAGNRMANYPADYPAETRNLSWKYRCGGTWGPTTSFQTDAQGQTWFSIDCPADKAWDGKLTMTLNQTSIEQNATELGLTNYTWQAAKVIGKLIDHQGNPLAGGVLAQGGGYWYTHGTTDGSGQVAFHTFPIASGTIKVRMTFGNVSEEKFPAVIAGTNTVIWQTGQVTISCPSSVQIAQGGTWFNYNSGQKVELLPRTYNYKGGCGTGTVTVTAGGTHTIP